uniref:Chromosome 11 open reading frame 52 n=1 Tax=Moschus moschiferus TaxID=68415 RepID=A0A8C6DUN9_MOSMO
MGNQLCCGRSWSCTSTLQREKKIGSQTRRTLRRQQQQSQRERWRRLNDTKDYDAMGHTYEQVVKQPASHERSCQSLRSEESSLYYADIQLYRLPQPRSVQEVKHLQLKNATEYATLRFPQVTPRYDSKNGTLV